MDFVKQGEPIKATWANDVVSAIRSVGSNPALQNPARRMNYRPFDVISMRSDGTDWIVKLAPSWIIDGNSTTSVRVQNLSSEWKDMDDYPEFKTQNGKNLYLDRNSKKLSWEESPQSDKLLILESVIPDGAEHFTLVNKHPAIVKGGANVGFKVINLREEDSGWVCNIALGYLRFVNPRNDAEEVVKDWIPDGMDSEPAPEYDVSDGESAYVLVNTDNKGIPTAVSIVIDSADKESIHYQPPPDEPDSVSVEGEYYYKIADFVMEDEAMTARQHQIGSPMIHTAPLWEGDNVGDGAYLVYKQIDPAENKFKFRTIKQLTGGTGKPILMPFDGDQPDEIEFRTISERESDAQIHVDGDVGDSAIKIRGNDYDAMIDLPGGGTIQTKDGLVYSNTPGIVGGDFNMKIQDWGVEIGGGGEIEVSPDGSPRYIYFRGGLATLSDPGGMAEEVSMTGTVTSF